MSPTDMDKEVQLNTMKHFEMTMENLSMLLRADLLRTMGDKIKRPTSFISMILRGENIF